MEAARHSIPQATESNPPAEPIREPVEEEARAVAPIEPYESQPTSPTHPPRPRRAEEREPGKGGKQHRYVQHLVKQLAEERGFRAVIEEAVEGGHVDVGLHRGELSIACEISVTSTADYEAQNLAKSLRAGFTQVWAVAPDQKRRRVIEAAAKARLGDEGFAKITFLTPEDLPLQLDHYALPEPEEKVVRGYKVKVTRLAVSPEEAAEKRATIARILANSLRTRDS